jgi:microsomal epoxide hydrolase
VLVTGRPFQIAVDDAVLEDVRERLARTRWPFQIAGTGWDYGTDVDYLKELCAYWQDGYDWRAAEARLNSYEQYVETIDGVDIHFLHVRGAGTSPFPLLCLHGWPGSVWEFVGVLDELSDPAAHGGDGADAFELVVPCLPGFGFSGKPREKGWGVTRIAAAMNELMRRCGYDSYGTQGGDWGGIISAQIGADHADRCAAIHINQTYAYLPPDPTPEQLDWAERNKRFRAAESAYSELQRTKPDSLTVAQNDSPAGLAAWIIEKFYTWGDTHGDIESMFSKDDLLTNVMIYWVTESAPSAARIYLEMLRDAHAQTRPPVTVPTGVAAFPKEPFIVPRSITETRYNLVRWTDMEAGGHFAALECPDALVADIRAFYRDIRPQ